MKFQEVIPALLNGKIALNSAFPTSEFLIKTGVLIRKTGNSEVTFTQLPEYLSNDVWSLKPEFVTEEATVSLTLLQTSWDSVLGPTLGNSDKSPLFKQLAYLLGF